MLWTYVQYMEMCMDMCADVQMCTCVTGMCAEVYTDVYHENMPGQVGVWACAMDICHG